LIDFTEIQIPIGDEELWGDPNVAQIEQCYVWPFGELLANLYKLARKNRIVWPLENYRDLDRVLAVMRATFAKLSADDKALIEEDYFWFLEKCKIITWRPMDIEEPPVMTREEMEKYYKHLDGLEACIKWNKECEARAKAYEQKKLSKKQSKAAV